MTEPNGLYYMKARYYDSEVGRFISEDPLGFEGGSLNLYVYAANNPIMFMDPTGLCAKPTSNPYKISMTDAYAILHEQKNHHYYSSEEWQNDLGEFEKDVVVTGGPYAVGAVTSVITKNEKAGMIATFISQGILGWIFDEPISTRRLGIDVINPPPVE
jgi:RHS repeat-associated protein